MPLVNSSIPNLVNGVSQQPYTLRLASQAELQENGLSTAAQGLKKRPPTTHIKKLGDRIEGSTAYIHTINRDTEERYIVVITPGDLRVFDVDGNEQTVNFPDGKDYLDTPDPLRAFRAVTVADYTFLLNRTVTVTESPVKTPPRPYEALVVVRNGLYSKKYEITIDGTPVAEFETPDGTDPEHAEAISTDYIAEQLSQDLTTNGITHDIVGSAIRIYSNTDFSISARDGYSNAALAVLKGRTQSFASLPTPIGFPDFTIQVAGDVSTSADDYWVKWDMSEGTGVWRETVAPDVSIGVDNHTMPMALIREADGTFTCRFIAWSTRRAGDMESAPNPSFVGRRIQDVFFYRNRLGFLADESVVLSEAGEFFNFFPTTVTTLLDSDPIDVSASHTKVSLLNFAVPFNKKLLLFSAQTQFSLEAGDMLTPRTVSIQPTTEFECNTLAAPVGMGRNVYFAVPKGDFEGVREYFVATDTDTEDAADITGHVPKYIPSGVYKLAAALNEDLLCLLSWKERWKIWVYKFYWSNNEKLQSSWSQWVFPMTDEILNIDFIQSDLFIVFNRPDGLYLEKMSVAPGEVDDREPYPVHLDRKTVVEPNPIAFDGTNTRLSLGWDLTDGTYMAVVANNQPQKAGLLLPVYYDENGAYIQGDYSDCRLIVGRTYTFRYRFSPLMIRTRDGDSQRADTVGRLQIRRLQVNFAETGFFEAEVTPYGRDTYTYTYTGKTLGLDSSNIGQVGIEDGKFSFPVSTKNTTATIDLVSDSPLPCAFLSADWEGYYVRRSQEV